MTSMPISVTRSVFKGLSYPRVSYCMHFNWFKQQNKSVFLYYFTAVIFSFITAYVHNDCIILALACVGIITIYCCKYKLNLILIMAMDRAGSDVHIYT